MPLGAGRCARMFFCFVSACVTIAVGVTKNSSPEKSGLFTTTQGLRIACLGGIFDEKLHHAAESPHVRMVKLYKVLCSLSSEGVYISIFHQTHDRQVAIKHNDIDIFRWKGYLLYFHGLDHSFKKSQSDGRYFTYELIP